MILLWLSSVARAAQDPAVQRGLVDYLKQVGELISALLVLLGVLWWLVWPRIRDGIKQIVVQVNETHRSVTVNHHSSPEPTMRDDLSDVKKHIKQVSDDLATVQDDQRALIREAATATTIASEVRDALNRHEDEGREAAIRVVRQLAEQGITLQLLPPEHGDGD